MTSTSNRKSDDTVIAEFTYSYDPTYWGKNGTRTRVVENILKPDGNRISAQVDYEYDDLYRLVREHRAPYNGGDAGVVYDKYYVYDAAGNRLSLETKDEQGNRLTYIEYTYDAANKMLTAGNSTFTYDDRGNTLTETSGNVTTTYTWDYLNHLTQWTKTGETTQSYVYNADGIRVRVTPSGGTAKDFLLDGSEIAEEIVGANVTSYVGPGLISEISSTARSVYHADGIGSTRAMSDGSQVITEAGIYDAYGNLAQDFPASSSPSFGYAGWYRYYADTTGLDYLKTRYYDPEVGRFTSRDPINYASGLNLYEYVYSNPVAYIDPSGRRANMIRPGDPRWPTIGPEKPRPRCMPLECDKRSVYIRLAECAAVCVAPSAGMIAVICPISAPGGAPAVIGCMIIVGGGTLGVCMWDCMQNGAGCAYGRFGEPIEAEDPYFPERIPPVQRVPKFMK